VTQPAIDPRAPERHSRAMRSWLFISAFGLSSCATLSTTLPESAPARVEAEKINQTREALKIYMADFRRLQDIALPVLAANTQFCDKIGVDIGAYTLSEKDLPKALRGKNGAPELKSPTILYVRPGTPSLFEGNVIIKNGKPVKVSALKPGIETIDTRARGVTSPVPVTATPICGYPVRLKYTPAINAYANGRSIIVTTGMMAFASDEELALIIGHELAHNTHGHIRKIVQNTILGFGKGTFARQFESEADYVGLYYSARAGYPIENAKEFWRKLARISVKSIDKPSTHPIAAQRYVGIDEAVAEIKAKQKAGLPLAPNPK